MTRMSKSNLFKPTTFKRQVKKDESDIQIAKNKPIQSYYKGKLKRTGNILQGMCPFHEETKGSFTIYTATNSWHCFSCGESGDSIGFFMKLNNISFNDAVKEMVNG